MWKNTKATFSLIILIITINAYAGDIPAPPPLPNETVVEQDYFQKIYNNWNELEEVTSNPDGTRSGDIGDMVLFNNSGTYYLEINTTGSTVWRGVLLTDTP